jgi:hypothetical protein
VPAQIFRRNKARPAPAPLALAANRAGKCGAWGIPCPQALRPQDPTSRPRKPDDSPSASFHETCSPCTSTRTARKGWFGSRCFFVRSRPMRSRPGSGRHGARSVIRSRRARSPDVPDFRGRPTRFPRGRRAPADSSQQSGDCAPTSLTSRGARWNLAPRARSPQVWRSRPCMTSQRDEFSANRRFVRVLRGMTHITFPAAGSARARHPLDLGSLPRATRCECQRCGVHTFPVLRHTVTSRCHNCGSEELVPVASSAAGPQRV